MANKFNGLRREYGTLEENPTEIQGMFSDHFKNIFFDYHLPKLVVVSRDACFKVVSCKVLFGDRDGL